MKKDLGTYGLRVEFSNGMTVAELKEYIRDWPETDEDGEPCEVWLRDSGNTTNQARYLSPLNKRHSEDGKSVWADLLIGYC